MPGSESADPPLTRAQEAVLQLVLEGRNLFLTGSAGTGKSRVLRAVVRRMHGAVALTAPTSSAATIIGGRTVHSWAGIGRAREAAEELARSVLRDYHAYSRWQSAKLLVIDEISMVSASLLDTLDRVGRIVRRCEARPFGGLQVLFCGDFFQLPPPGGDSEGWAFEAGCWDRAVEFSIELTEVLRVDPDEVAFAGVLEQVRQGAIDDSAWAFLQDLARRPQDPGRPATAVVPTNSIADMVNERSLRQLCRSRAPGPVDINFTAQSLGPGGESHAAFRATALPSQLRLCVGAVVVLTQSVSLGPNEDAFANGTQCRVTDFVKLPPHMYDPRNPHFDCTALKLEERRFLARHEGVLPRVRPVEAADGGGEYTLYPVAFSDGECPVVQLPARLGWAVTAHRSQGMTLDAAVVHLQGVFSSGQAYVALSRCRRARDLWLADLPRRTADGHVAAFAPSSRVTAFYAKLRGAELAAAESGTLEFGS